MAGNGGTLSHFQSDPADPDGPLTATVVDSPSKAQINGLWGSSADDVWAVGSGGTILHWDGASWSLIHASANTADGADDLGDLYCVWGSGIDDIWIGGRTTLLHRGSTQIGGTSP